MQAITTDMLPQHDMSVCLSVHTGGCAVQKRRS